MTNLLFENRIQPVFSFRENNICSKPHFHRSLEMIYALNGEGRVTADRKVYKLHKGEIFLSFPNQIHSTETIAEGDFIVIIFSPDIVFGMDNLLFENTLNDNVVDLNDMPNFKKLILKVVSQVDFFESTMKIGLINEIIATILPLYNLKPKIKTNNTTVQEILNFCSDRFTENITLDDISENLNISKFHISNLFNNKLGIGFNSYINTLRVNLACDMLENTANKVSYISEEVGFGSIRSFNRVFKEIMNTTPYEYRKQFESIVAS